VSPNRSREENKKKKDFFTVETILNNILITVGWLKYIHVWPKHVCTRSYCQVTAWMRGVWTGYSMLETYSLALIFTASCCALLPFSCSKARNFLNAAFMALALLLEAIMRSNN
jgi:hypothetical protein